MLVTMMLLTTMVVVTIMVVTVMVVGGNDNGVYDDVANNAGGWW